MLKNLNSEEQINQKIRDLDDLEKQGSEDQQMSGEEDSDKEDMKRIIQYSDDENGESEADEEDENMDSISDSEMEEEGEQEIEESDNSSEGKLVPKKRTLKSRLAEEKAIRKQEARMREGKS